MLGFAMGGGGFGRTDWLRTAFNWAVPLKLRLSGCQVRRRHESSPVLLATESLRPGNPDVDMVGEETKFAFGDERAPALELLTSIGPGPRPGI